MFAPLILAASLLADAPAPVKPADTAAAAPVSAPADRTETISLTYVSAGDVEQVLTGQTGSRNGGLGTGKVLIPPTVHAWSVEVSRNSLTLVGDREGIDAVKQIIRLLDVPARRLSIELRFVRLEAGADPLGLAARLVEADEVSQLASRPSVQLWTLPATNNRAMTFRTPAGSDDMEKITARINGDGSITLIVGTMEKIAGPPAKRLDDLDVLPGPPDGAATTVHQLLLRRVPSGQAMGVAYPRAGMALLIRPTLLPDSPAPEKAR